MEQEKDITTVEQLEHFPFKSFNEFKKANAESVAHIAVDRAVALQWAQNGKYAPKSIKRQSLVFAALPFLSALGLIIYAVVTGTWLLLLALPLLLVAFFILHPSSAMVFGFLRSGFIGLIFIGLVYSFFAEKHWLLVLCLALVVIWYSQKAIYKKAIKGIIIAMIEHEDLLCLVWKGRMANIEFFNGNRYWADWKIEDGKSIHYNEN